MELPVTAINISRKLSSPLLCPKRSFDGSKMNRMFGKAPINRLLRSLVKLPLIVHDYLFLNSEDDKEKAMFPEDNLLRK
ncbi:hypothetical protein L2E82_37842 [Cichorium intybus]|uniref:Uncharacterized protein n=1 Tax=Cichorium intybus TaxID=13427 RepID=A0ACB9AFT8_CICIN|nr:hypothetical protein L2E82_37842 [Cichorium intybus]